MDNNTWEPVALIPATLSDDSNTAIEVAQTRGGIYLLPMESDGDTGARDCCLTMDEARQLALAILALTGPAPTAARAQSGSVSHLGSRRTGALVGSSVRLQAVA